MSEKQGPPPTYDPQQQAAYPPPVQSSTQTVTVVAAPTVIVQSVNFRDFPVTMTDSNGQQFTTVIEYHNGLLTWIAVGLICLFTVELCLCCLAVIPFFLNDFKDVHHLNPNTNEVVGIYKRLS